VDQVDRTLSRLVRSPPISAEPAGRPGGGRRRRCGDDGCELPAHLPFADDAAAPAYAATFQSRKWDRGPVADVTDHVRRELTELGFASVTAPVAASGLHLRGEAETLHPGAERVVKDAYELWAAGRSFGVPCVMALRLKRLISETFTAVGTSRFG
jgi:hypothetical protein